MKTYISIYNERALRADLIFLNIKKNDKLKLIFSLNMMNMMLTSLSALRCLLTVLHAYLIADFVHSRPPGRKMVFLKQ